MDPATATRRISLSEDPVSRAIAYERSENRQGFWAVIPPGRLSGMSSCSFLPFFEHLRSCADALQLTQRSRDESHAGRAQKCQWIRSQQSAITTHGGRPEGLNIEDHSHARTRRSITSNALFAPSFFSSPQGCRNCRQNRCLPIGTGRRGHFPDIDALVYSG